MDDTGQSGKPRKIYYKHRGVEVDMANGEIYIKGRWYHAAEIQHWERASHGGINIYLDDPNLPMFKWKTIWQPIQDKMVQAIMLVR